MRKQYAVAVNEINKKNGKELESRSDQYISAIYGEKESKTSSGEIENVRDAFIKSNTYELVDPINILEKIEKIENEINEFSAEVDSTLSCSNALTQITIEY